MDSLNLMELHDRTQISHSWSADVTHAHAWYGRIPIGQNILPTLSASNLQHYIMTIHLNHQTPFFLQLLFFAKKRRTFFRKSEKIVRIWTEKKIELS